MVGFIDEPTTAQTFTIMAAGIVGALAYTFSDSFWFSAVEGEVYALSSFFTALVFWAMLKWERADVYAGNNAVLRSPCRPLDHFHLFYDGPFHWCALVELIDHPGHCNDLLLQAL